jgi:hypothetical protein
MSEPEQHPRHQLTKKLVEQMPYRPHPQAAGFYPNFGLSVEWFVRDVSPLQWPLLCAHKRGEASITEHVFLGASHVAN